MEQGCFGSHRTAGANHHRHQSLSHETAFTHLYAMTRQAPGGINSQALAAIENALLDIKGKALGVPCYELFGGKLRDRLPLYWSHCGTYRMNEFTSKFLRKPVLKSVEDLIGLGREGKRCRLKHSNATCTDSARTARA